MTIDEAIADNLRIAEGQDKCAEISVSEHAKERMKVCADEHRQLAEWLRELKEAKRLLKSAIDEWHIVCEWGNCGEYCGWYVNGQCTQKWSGESAALKLIGETNGEP